MSFFMKMPPKEGKRDCNLIIIASSPAAVKLRGARGNTPGAQEKTPRNSLFRGG
jgi:hypothetical protein